MYFARSITDSNIKIWKLYGAADPLELQGGFSSLNYDTNATIESSLAENGIIRWRNLEANELKSSTIAQSATGSRVSKPRLGATPAYSQLVFTLISGLGMGPLSFP